MRGASFTVNTQSINQAIVHFTLNRVNWKLTHVYLLQMAVDVWTHCWTVYNVLTVLCNLWQILSLLVTYFLLVVQFADPSSSTSTTPALSTNCTTPTYDWRALNTIHSSFVIQCRMDNERHFILRAVTYRMGQKMNPKCSTHNFFKYWPILKILSLLQSPENLQCSGH